jgi:hypothetical protein
MKTEERIIKYLDNQLSGEERINFEKELESSEELKEDFRKYFNIEKNINDLKSVKLNPEYVDSILPQFQNRIHSRKKESIRKSLAYAFGVMLMFLIGIAVLRIFFNNQKNPNDLEEFTQSLNENQKVELLENLNCGEELYKLIPENELADLIGKDLQINNEVAKAYDIGYNEIIDGLSQKEAEVIYNEILNRNILKEVPL